MGRHLHHRGVGATLDRLAFAAGAAVEVGSAQIGHGADWIKLYADYRRGPGGSNAPTLTEAEMEPLLNDYRRVRVRDPSGNFSLCHMDELVDSMLRMDHMFNIALPRLPAPPPAPRDPKPPALGPPRPPLQP